MKRLVSPIIMLFLLTVLLVGCQADDTASTPTLNAKIAKATGFTTTYSEYTAEYDDPKVITQVNYQPPRRWRLLGQ